MTSVATLRDKCAAVIAFEGEYQRTVEACAKSPLAEMGRYDAYLRKRSTIDLHGPDIARALLSALDVVEAAEDVEREHGRSDAFADVRMALCRGVFRDKLAAFHKQIGGK